MQFWNLQCLLNLQSVQRTIDHETLRSISYSNSKFFIILNLKNCSDLYQNMECGASSCLEDMQAVRHFN